MKSEKPLGRKNYGSIPHLLGSKLGKTDKYVHEGMHRILTEKTRDKHDFITVTEKYDGSNVGIAKLNNKIIALTRSGYLAKTSPFKQHYYFSEWVEKNKKRFDFINEKERLAGEWLLQIHSTEYEIKKEPFVVFDYFTKENQRILYAELIQITNIPEILIPRILFSGNTAISINLCMNELLNKYCHSIIAKKNKPEGIVYRIERKRKFDFMAKYIHNDFKPGIFMDQEKYNCSIKSLKL